MKRKIYSDPEEVRKELQAIADELNLPINDEKVGFTWTGGYGRQYGSIIKRHQF